MLGCEGLHELCKYRHSEKKEEVGSGERSSILVFLSLNCIGEVVSTLPYRTLEFAVVVMVDDGEIK